LSPSRPLSILVLFLSLALAGCAGNEGGSDGASATQTSSATDSALAAVIRILTNGTVAAPANGSIPAQAGAELTFDGSGSTGAILEYAWDFGDNATGADQTETHAFAAGGLYNVTLTVKGLGNASANATVRIDVAADPSGGFLFTQGHTFAGDLPLSNPNSCTNQGVDCQDHVVTIVAADANGTPALATRVSLVVDGSCPVPGPVCALQVFWRSPDGTNLNQTAAEGIDHALTYAGDMAPGDYVVRVRLFTGAQASYDAIVAVEYVHA
jgi:PKD repeat protein